MSSEAIRLVAEGLLTDKEIAFRCGVSVEAVRAWRRERKRSIETARKLTKQSKRRT